MKIPTGNPIWHGFPGEKGFSEIDLANALVSATTSVIWNFRGWDAYGLSKTTLADLVWPRKTDLAYQSLEDFAKLCIWPKILQ
jgi:hypothetical protein